MNQEGKTLCVIRVVTFVAKITFDRDTQASTTKVQCATFEKIKKSRFFKKNGRAK
jgi:hypothetical protein